METFSHILIWASVLFVALTLIILLCYIPYLIIVRKKASPVKTPAKVISKAMQNLRARAGYYVAFALPNGTRKNLKVTVEEYNTMVEGEVGILTYKKYKHHIWFESFRPQSYD